MDSFNNENKKPATNKELSLIDRKFSKGEAFVPPLDRDNFVGFRPHHIFLYGTLMDPIQLRKVLRLENTPTLEPASIVGWKVMLWGQYPALVFKPGNVIHGMAYKVQKESHMEYLEYYETEIYKVKGCNIKLGNGTEVPGETFIYNGDKNLLKEGTFDLKDQQMGQLEKEL